MNIDELDIKIVRLSDEKVRLHYKAPLICSENIINVIDMRVRYRLSNGVYKMIFPKPIFLNRVSNFYRVKKKFIHYGTLFYSTYPYKTFDYNGLKFDNFIKSLYIADENWFKSWNRDSKILNILSK